MESTRIVQALRQAIIEEMDKEESIVLLGEDIGVFNGSYRVTEGLLERYGEKRVKDTPISEIAIVGAAIGAAMTGLRPIAEIQFNDFMGCAMDQICNQAAKIRLMMGGQVSVPMVIRAPYGATGRAAQHSQSLEAWFAHIPGLKVVMPSTPYDAKGLLKTAIKDNNPVVFLEHKLLYGATSPGGKAKSVVDDLDQTFKAAPEEEYYIEFGQADIKRSGEDATIVAIGYMVHRAVEAAKKLASEGISCEIVDPRTVAPLDKETILKSVKKTGRLVIVTESAAVCGIAAEIAAILSEDGIFDLDAPIRRVCAKHTPIPFAPCCESDVLPKVEDIVTAVKEICGK